MNPELIKMQILITCWKQLLIGLSLVVAAILTGEK